MKRFSVFLATAGAMLLCGTSSNVEAQQVYRCVVDGRTIYQQEPCGLGQKSREVNTEPPVTSLNGTSPPPPSARPASVPVSASAPEAPVAAQPATAPVRTALEAQADACLDWYRPLLRDPRGAYHRDARIEKNVLTLTLYATNRRGGYEQLTGACEFKSGRLDESWTKIHAKRHGWLVN